MTMADKRVKEPKGVKLDHISKIYQDPKTGKDFYAVHDVALDIVPGSFVTLLGPSGCGRCPRTKSRSASRTSWRWWSFPAWSSA